MMAMGIRKIVATAGIVLATPVLDAQELQPRRWSHLPIGSNFSGFSYGYTSADIYFSPSLQVDNATLEMHTVATSYLHAFEFLGRSARFDIVQAYQYGRWEGTLEGLPASTSRTGMTDTVVRLSMNLVGAPPLKGQEFRKYRAAVADCETIVGVGLTTILPTGRYLKDRLLNIGTNRVTVRPEFGIVHNRGPWSYEWDLGIYFFSDNDSFFQGNTLEQDPIYATQAHVVYTFRPGLWVGVGAAFGTGGQTSVNDRPGDDTKNNFLWGASIGIPVNRKVGMKLTYISTNSLERAGFDSHSVLFGASMMW